MVEVLKQCPLRRDLVRDKTLYFQHATSAFRYHFVVEVVRDEIQLTLDKNPQNCNHFFLYWIVSDNEVKKI